MVIKKTFFALVAFCAGAKGYTQQIIIQTPEVMALRKIKDSTELHAKLKALGTSGSEKDYSTLHTYYKATNSKLADSVGRVAVSRFPKGSVALDIASKKMFVKDIVQQEKALTELRAEFPDQQFDKFYGYIVRSFLEEKNAAGTFRYLDLMSEKERATAFTSAINTASLFDAQATAAYLAHQLASKKLPENERLNILLLQSDALHKLGDYQKAFESISIYYNSTSRKTPYLEAEYYLLMSKTGGQAAALPHLEKAMLNRIGGEALKQELLKAYAKVNPGKDVAAYMAELNDRLGDATRNEVAQHMVNEKAPAFTVVDEQGKNVSLADFKGKTIVIDFWATWCGPCKRALPSMQATVNKYKNDPNVVFLFIHTWEGKSKDGDVKVAARKYFTENNYDNLPLYWDLQNAQKVNPAVSAFKVTGIPAKFVIDGNGNIRFRKEGAGMDMDFAVAELSAMIELAKKG